MNNPNIMHQAPPPPRNRFAQMAKAPPDWLGHNPPPPPYHPLRQNFAPRPTYKPCMVAAASHAFPPNAYGTVLTVSNPPPHLAVQQQLPPQQPPPPLPKEILQSMTPVVLQLSPPDVAAAPLSPNEDSLDAKRKTPMCLINELARYNKITHQYRLTGESGPAHKKRFTVTLKLGDEEYTSEGPSIKKAQHSAADEAVAKTKYKHPPQKNARPHKLLKKHTSLVTPTVQLNAVLMKLGLTAEYAINVDYQPTDENCNGRPMFRRPGPGGGGFRPPFPCKVTLTIGQQQFFGTGPTVQAAKHCAATQALEVYNSAAAATEAAQDSGDNDADEDLKSPVSLVHEIALKRQMPVAFEVKDEKGPPHMKVFTTICTVGGISTEGEGNGKKTSKRRAAMKMLDELRKLPPLSISPNIMAAARKRKTPVTKRKKRNLVKEDGTSTVQTPVAEEINPISKLIQIMQARKEKEPIYTLKEERGAPRRREFVIEVTAGGLSASGSGPNKKLAKRNAAENLLSLMGDPQAVARQPSPVQPLTQQPQTQSRPAKEAAKTNSLPAGVLIIKSESPPKKEETAPPSTPAASPKPDEAKTPSSEAKSQLLYLADLLGFKVKFQNFAKSSHGENLTLLTLSTIPPQVCHGLGKTEEESSAEAAAKAMGILEKIGIDNIKCAGSESGGKDGVTD